MKTIKIKYMTKFLACLALVMVVSACENKPDYKTVRKQVMDMHDELMIDGELAIRNKMSLDTLSKTGLGKLHLADPKIDTLAEQKQIAELVSKLNEADENMMDWMQVFRPEVDGISNEQAIKYFQQEKQKLIKMDSLFKSALGQSDEFLKKYKVKKTTEPVDHKGHNH